MVNTGLRTNRQGAKYSGIHPAASSSVETPTCEEWSWLYRRDDKEALGPSLNESIRLSWKKNFFPNHLNIGGPKTESLQYGNTANDWGKKGKLSWSQMLCNLLAGRRGLLLDMPSPGWGCWSGWRRAKGSKLSFLIFDDNFMLQCYCFSCLHGGWRHLGRGALVGHRGGRSRRGWWGRRWGRTRDAGDVIRLSVCVNDDSGTVGGLAKVDKI